MGNSKYHALEETFFAGIVATTYHDGWSYDDYAKYHALEETFFAGTAPDKKAVEQLKKKYHFY